MMRKEELYLYITTKFMEDHIYTFTQKGLAQKLDMSISVIHNALQPLREMGAITVNNRDFQVFDLEKILVYWATIRRINKEIVYSTFVAESIETIESTMPGNSIFTAYSGYKFKVGDVPADYSAVYVYGGEKEIRKRFSEKKGPKNLFVLHSLPIIEELSSEGVAPLSLIFVDLWGLRDWYSKEFIKDFRRRFL